MALYFLTVTVVVSLSSLLLRRLLGTRAALVLLGLSLLLAYAFPPVFVQLGLTKSLVLYGALLPVAGSLVSLFAPRPAGEPAEKVVKLTGETAPDVEITQMVRDMAGAPAVSAGPTVPATGDSPASTVQPPPFATTRDTAEDAASIAVPLADGEPVTQVAPLAAQKECPDLAEPTVMPAGNETPVAEEPLFAGPGDTGEEAAAVRVPPPLGKPEEIVVPGDEVATGPEPPSAGELVRQAIALARREEFAGAVRTFLAALVSASDANLQGLIVTELSTLYQQLGHYAMAADLIETFLTTANGSIPPALAVTLREKMAFNRYLKEALDRNGMPGLPYHAVPDLIKRRAYVEATMK